MKKVLRLVEILDYLNTNPLLKGRLGLKGGTAINLFIFDLPRLSVDIDLDYLFNNSKEEMLQDRERINDTINRYMFTQGYSKHPKTKNHHSLDSWIFNYINGVGNKDNIKIEINYSLRAHILETESKSILNHNFSHDSIIASLSKFEVYASKICALLSRAAARDLYDVYKMVSINLFGDNDRDLLRKCIVFYIAISANDKNSINKTFDTTIIDSITIRKIKTDLKPVIKTKDDFELVVARKTVKKYIEDLMILTSNEIEFLNKFEAGEYKPELLFDEKGIVDRIKNHPMALWKTK